MKISKLLCLTLLITLFTLANPVYRAYAANVGIGLEITPESFLDENFIGTCCLSEDLTLLGSFPIFQEFTPTQINRLTKVRLEFYGTGNENYTIYIHDSDGNVLGSSTALVNAPGWTDFDFFPAIELPATDVTAPYRIVFTQSTTDLEIAYDDPGDYAGGEAFKNGLEMSTRDYHFETWGYFVEGAAEPIEPPIDGGSDGDGNLPPIIRRIQNFIEETIDEVIPPLTGEPGEENKPDKGKGNNDGDSGVGPVGSTIILWLCIPLVIFLITLPLLLVFRRQRRKEE